MYSQLNILGRLAKDPEPGMTQAGMELCKFTIAYDTGYGDHKKANFLDCVCFGKKSIPIVNFFKKGSPIFVTGELSQNKWEDKSGNVRYSFSLNVLNFSFTDEKKNASVKDEFRGEEVTGGEDLF